MEKPKLTEEQAVLMYNTAKRYEIDFFKKVLIDAGFMEKPETAFERAERLWREYTNGVTDDTDIDSIREIINAYREALVEITEAKEAAK